MSLAYRLTDLPLFAEQEELPRIRIEPPSAPGSKTSEDAADAIKPLRAKSHRRILYTLASLSPDKCLSREEIAERTGMKEASPCARIYELQPMWIEVLEGACLASSHKKVNGYRLTDAARKLTWDHLKDGGKAA